MQRYFEVTSDGIVLSGLFFPAGSTTIISIPNVKLETIYYSDGHLVAEIYWLATELQKLFGVISTPVNINLMTHG